jgi:hypothetical protein
MVEQAATTRSHLVTPSIADGVPSSDLVRTAGPTPVFIGGIRCDVPFVGLSSTEVGLNRLVWLYHPECMESHRFRSMPVLSSPRRM